MKSVKAAKFSDWKTLFAMNSSYWNPRELPVLPSSKIVSRRELTDNWILNETLLRTFLRRGGLTEKRNENRKVLTTTIIIQILFHFSHKEQLVPFLSFKKQRSSFNSSNFPSCSFRSDWGTNVTSHAITFRTLAVRTLNGTASERATNG